MGGRCDDGQLVATDFLQPTLKNRDGEEEGNDGNDEGDGASWAEEHFWHEAGEVRIAIDQTKCSYIKDNMLQHHQFSSVQEISAQTLSTPLGTARLTDCASADLLPLTYQYNPVAN